MTCVNTNLKTCLQVIGLKPEGDPYINCTAKVTHNMQISHGAPVKQRRNVKGEFTTFLEVQIRRFP